MKESFEYSEWYKPGGGMIYRRSALNHDHPESIPSLWKAKYGTPMPYWAAVKVWGEEAVEKELCPCCGGDKFKEPFR